MFLVQQDGGLFPHKGVILRDNTAEKHLPVPACKMSTHGLPALSQASKSAALLDQKGREVSQKEGCRASTAGEGGTAMTIASCLLSHRCPMGIQARHLFSVACSSPVATPKSVLCQMLIPGDMHHDFINHTCSATGLPLAPMCEPQVSLHSTNIHLRSPTLYL